jgi:hypothetical protein
MLVIKEIKKLETGVASCGIMPIPNLVKICLAFPEQKQIDMISPVCSFRVHDAKNANRGGV